MDENIGRAAGGYARAERLSPERRKQIARQAAAIRWVGNLPRAEYEGSFPLGNIEIACAVLQDETRIITQATFLRALGRSRSPKAGTGVLSTADELPFFLQAEILRPFIDDESAALARPVFYISKSGGKGVGYDARLLRHVAEVYLRFRDHCLASRKAIPERYAGMIQAADMLIRGLADVGIVGLVDEATGYQRDRATDALAKILEAFIAKELRPWVRTFPDEFYQHLFRLRGVEFPKDTVKRPQYFGHLTNDIIYRRLAPGVLDELRRVVPRTPSGRRKHPFTRRLTEEIGHPRLREHLSGVITVMKLSNDYDDFIGKLDRTHPRYGDNLELPFDGTPSPGL